VEFEGELTFQFSSVPFSYFIDAFSVEWIKLHAIGTLACKKYIKSLIKSHSYDAC